ncbi:MAG: hypothetical protein B0A82_04110 [Alkalinema sp. CACIAM 70d]|nr:MAG: hypothetical protein B0A82_04110 [Alkalinema sp. CACIAM 70d]
MFGLSPSWSRQVSRQILSAIVLASVVVPLAPGAWQTPFTPPAAEASSYIQKEIASLKKSQQRWIEIDLSSQRLIAWEGKRWVDAKIVSTGKASTPTRTGVFEIQEKFRSVTMKGADYEVPDVPHAMFYSGNYAIHGAYWHSSFGTPVSHGCVNMAPDAAQWLYSWARVGTPIVIHD